jgi:DNA topoisomerase-1
MANHTPSTAISNDRISKAEDKAMDEQVPSNGHVEPGISIRMGPVDAMDVDAPATNGANGKRKARASLTNGKTYKDASSSEEDDKPLVRSFPSQSARAMR